MSPNRGVGNQVAVILEHALLRLVERVHVGPDFRDHVVDEWLGVAAWGARTVVARRTADAPVGALECARDEAGDQPALADRADLVAEDLAVAIETPDQA